MTTGNATLQGTDEIRLTIPAADVRSENLVSKATDSVEEFGSTDSEDALTGPSNRKDSDAFDSNCSGTQRGLARGTGNISATPPEGAVHPTFAQAAGVLCFDVTVNSVTTEKRQIQEEADIFYYSGHGTHSSGTLAFGGPSVVSPYWSGGDINTFIVAGCAVLDINDYNNYYTGSEHTASPGKKWEPIGPSLFLGYNYYAPLDDQNSDTIITAWCTSRASSGDIAAWKDANDNSNGRNACAIETGANYYYFKKGGIYPFNTYTWTVVPKSAW